MVALVAHFTHWGLTELMSLPVWSLYDWYETVVKLHGLDSKK